MAPSRVLFIAGVVLGIVSGSDLFLDARSSADATATCSSTRRAVVKQELNAQNSWVNSADRSAKYASMRKSAFSFYRGTAHLFYKDASDEQWLSNTQFHSDTTLVWAQGDLHLENFGTFTNDRDTVIFDVNDFDEGYVSSYLFDIYRLATSMVLVAKENGQGSGSDIEDIVGKAFAETYLDTLDSLNGNDGESNATMTSKTAKSELKTFMQGVEQSESRAKMLAKWTTLSGSDRKLNVAYKDLGEASSDDKNAMIAAIRDYRTNCLIGSSGKLPASAFAVKDVAWRLNAGTGSLGTPRLYVLLEGSSSDPDDDIILDVKRQGWPAMHPYVDQSTRSRMTNLFADKDQATRVAVAQKSMLNDVDDYLGCGVLNGEPYSVRQRDPFKETFDTDDLIDVSKFVDFAEQIGLILARAHARSDKDNDGVKGFSNPITWNFENAVDAVTNHHHDEFQADVIAKAVSYAFRVEEDFVCFNELLDAGEIY